MKAIDLQASAGRAALLLKAMSNPSRLLILCQLVDGEKSVTALQVCVGLSQSALSQHLAVLRRTGVVATRREARLIYYALASDEAAAVMNTLYAVFCAGKRPRAPAARRHQGVRGAVLSRVRMT